MKKIYKVQYIYRPTDNLTEGKLYDVEKIMEDGIGFYYRVFNDIGELVTLADYVVKRVIVEESD